MQRNFVKNDQGFICQVCGLQVQPLVTSSRDHCTFCLASIHIDIMPGDRKNTCLGVLKPVGIQNNQSKGLMILYKCQKCGQEHRNKTAIDDDYDTILKVSNHTYEMF